MADLRHGARAKLPDSAFANIDSTGKRSQVSRCREISAVARFAT